MDAAEIDDRPALTDCAENPAFPDEHLLDSCVVRQHRQHHVGLMRKLGRRCVELGAAVHQGPGLVCRAVVDPQRIAGIEQHGRPAARRNRGREGRTIDAGDHPERRVGRDDGRAGVAGAEERPGFAARDQGGGHANRRAGLAAHGCGRVRHLDDVGRIDNGDGKASPVGMRVERLLDPGGDADECNLDVEMARGSDRAVHDRRRRMVAAHRVNGDADHRERTGSLLVDGADLALAVIPAMRADPVGRLRLVALRAQAGRGRAQRIVRAALGRACLRVSAFWIRHFFP